MSIRSFVNLLLLMIAMQSGIVAADIHDFVFSPAQEQQTDLSNHQEIHEQLSQHSHSGDTQIDSDCAHCVHSHCSHFVALNHSPSLNIKDYRDNFFCPYLQTTETGFTASMYRPPKS